jgi:hypothetical protein
VTAAARSHHPPRRSLHHQGQSSDLEASHHDRDDGGTRDVGGHLAGQTKITPANRRTHLNHESPMSSMPRPVLIYADG